MTIIDDVDVATHKPNRQTKTNLPNKPKTKHNRSNKPKKHVAIENPDEPNNLLSPITAKMIHS